MADSSNLVTPEAFLAVYPSDVQRLAQALRALVKTAVPDAEEAVRPGWQLIGYRARAGRRRAYFGFVAPHADHVALGFEYGVLLADPAGLLQPMGRQVYQVRIRPGEALQPEPLQALIREAARVALLSRAEKGALQLEREARAELDE